MIVFPKFIKNFLLSFLRDTNVGGVADGQVLTYDSASSKWVPRTPSSGAGGNLTDGFSLGIKASDTNTIPTDASTFVLNLAQSDSNVNPTDNSTFVINLAATDSNVIPTEAFSLGIKAAETNAIPSENFSLGLGLIDSNATQTETVQLKFPSGDFGDANPAPTDTRVIAVRFWASGCTTNDVAAGHTVAPANQDGQTNGTFSNCTTGTGTADLTNPITTTTGSMNVSGGITVVSSNVRVYFKVAAVSLAFTDTLNIKISSNGGFVTQTIWNGPALTTVGYAGEDYSVAGLAVGVTMTLAQLQAAVITASYTASVVAVPQTSIKIDSITMEVTVVI